MCCIASFVCGIESLVLYCMCVAVCECVGETVSMVVLLGGSRHPLISRSGNWASHVPALSGECVAWRHVVSAVTSESCFLSGVKSLS